MSRYFRQYAPAMIKIKKEIFGVDYNDTRKVVKEMDDAELYGWMAGRYQEYDRELREGLVKESV
ncbi:hypothetical protein CR203_21525 [Salipaludibacillus neizhouensis]|uniref:Uncharacterized protein n=2 Tax=Salipaludibacillus neizhouensis TaxID=885475 RepID=A0A3A9JXP2_9BACI|nr:hypothetical protein [Salipaludibacillus neizhouensis]RKL65257.1 hypothetical protein CR203_21525 [Salipaludibacillus neizhouensis]